MVIIPEYDCQNYWLIRTVLGYEIILPVSHPRYILYSMYSILYYIIQDTRCLLCIYNGYITALCTFKFLCIGYLVYNRVQLAAAL